MRLAEDDTVGRHLGSPGSSGDRFNLFFFLTGRCDFASKLSPEPQGREEKCVLSRWRFISVSVHLRRPVLIPDLYVLH